METTGCCGWLKGKAGQWQLLGGTSRNSKHLRLGLGVERGDTSCLSDGRDLELGQNPVSQGKEAQGTDKRQGGLKGNRAKGGRDVRPLMEGRGQIGEGFKNSSRP